MTERITVTKKVVETETTEYIDDYDVDDLDYVNALERTDTEISLAEATDSLESIILTNEENLEDLVDSTTSASSITDTSDTSESESSDASVEKVKKSKLFMRNEKLKKNMVIGGAAGLILLCLCCLIFAFVTIFYIFYTRRKVTDKIDFSKFATSSNYHLLFSRPVDFIDVHGHIFSADYVPSDVIPQFLYGTRNHENGETWDKVKDYVEGFSKKLRDVELPSWIKSSKYEILESVSKEPSEILSDWHFTLNTQLERDMFHIRSEAASVALPIDFDLAYKFHENSVTYLDQFEMTKKVCNEYNDDVSHKGIALFGFALDPRKLERLIRFLPKGYTPPLSEEETDEYVQYLNDALSSGAVACKVYPTLGFLPTHPVLMRIIWPKFEEFGIPVYTHMSNQGIYFSGTHLTYLDPKSDKGFVEGEFLTTETKEEVFAHPNQWREVIRAFPKLKVNFAHFGGAVQVFRDVNEKTVDNGWDELIVELMGINHPHSQVYTDISYFWTRNQMLAVVEKATSHGISDRILFGTDYYISLVDSTPKKILRKFFDVIDWEYIGKLSSYTNPLRFLEPSPPQIISE